MLFGAASITLSLPPAPVIIPTAKYKASTNEIFNLSTTTTVSPIVADFDNIFVDLPANAETINEETFFAALDNYDSFYETSLVNQSLLESRNFNPINSPDNIEKLKVVTTGFLDPTATYLS